MMRTPASGNALLILLLVSFGCAYHAPNAALEKWDPEYGYRPRESAERPSGESVVVLAFSGGGTRAAALSYGILQELRDTPILVGGESKRLLDEVDLITSVSGGSFTSAYYGLFGDRIFEDFEERVLNKKIERSLIFGLLNPWNWLRMMRPGFDRSELAIELYDEEIFDEATFADLVEAPGPFLNINATDLGAGNRFTFAQPQFDLICSDLSQLEVARAVTASSAVPVVFSPITLENHAGSCGFERPDWLENALVDRRRSRRLFWDAKIAESYLDSDKRKYIHLVDGGIADNLGLRGPLDIVRLQGGILNLYQIGIEHPKRIVVVVVDAGVQPEPSFSQSWTSPSLKAVIDSVTGVQLYRYNFETLELMRATLENWSRDLTRVEGRPVRSYLIEVTFQSIEDPTERAKFDNIPTSLQLDEQTVQQLIEIGRRLLRESPEFQALLQDLAADSR